METQTNPTEEVSTPAPEADHNPAEAVPDQAEVDAPQDANPEEAAEEFEEIEHDGKRYAVPKELKESFMKNADYTRKTQEVSESKKSLESEKAEFQKQAEAHRTDLQTYAELHVLEQQLKQFENVNWNAEIDKDPVEAFKLKAHFDTINNAYRSRRESLSQREQERSLKQQRETAKQAEEGRARLHREIKGWSPELESSLKDYLKKAGVADRDSVSFELYPEQVKILHKAFLYDQILEKSGSKPASPPPKPVKTLTSSNKAAKDPSSMSDAEFAQYRRRQIAQRH